LYFVIHGWERGIRTLEGFVTAVPIDLDLLEPQVDQRLHYGHVYYGRQI
jgi:hypothetical protein